jgi:intracellular septation protein A
MEQINISKNALFSGIILLVAGLAILAAGNDTFGFVKITLAPVLILTAFGLVAFSVMGKKRNTDV